jgi:hypothetical protein
VGELANESWGVEWGVRAVPGSSLVAHEGVGEIEAIRG